MQSLSQRCSKGHRLGFCVQEGLQLPNLLVLLLQLRDELQRHSLPGSAGRVRLSAAIGLLPLPLLRSRLGSWLCRRYPARRVCGAVPVVGLATDVIDDLLPARRKCRCTAATRRGNRRGCRTTVATFATTRSSTFATVASTGATAGSSTFATVASTSTSATVASTGATARNGTLATVASTALAITRRGTTPPVGAVAPVLPVPALP